MSQMFETDIGSLFPKEDADVDARLVDMCGKMLPIRDRLTLLENGQLRLLDLIEKMVELDKTRARAFDLLDERVKRAAVHAGLRQQAIDALNARISTLEQEVRNG